MKFNSLTIKYYFILVILFVRWGAVVSQSSDEAETCEIKHWFYDQDNDYYYGKDSLSCERPGYKWRDSKFIRGFDLNDNNMWAPVGNENLLSIQELKFQSGKNYILYLDKVFESDSVWVHLLDKDFLLKNIVFADSIPLPFISGDKLYTRANISYPFQVIHTGQEKLLKFSYDTAELISLKYDQENEVDIHYRLDNIIPRWMNKPPNALPGLDLISDLSIDSNQEFRNLLFSDEAYFRLWAVLYGYPNLRTNVEVLKLLKPTGGGMHTQYHPKEYLMKVVNDKQQQLRYEPGVASGVGAKLKTKHLRTEGLNRILIPRELAAELNGNKYSDFYELENQIRSWLWDNALYRKFLDEKKFKIYYLEPLYKTLDAYDLDNMIITTEEIYLNEIEPINKLPIWETTKK